MKLGPSDRAVKVCLTEEQYVKKYTVRCVYRQSAYFIIFSYFAEGPALSVYLACASS